MKKFVHSYDKHDKLFCASYISAFSNPYYKPYYKVGKYNF